MRRSALPFARLVTSRNTHPTLASSFRPAQSPFLGDDEGFPLHTHFSAAFAYKVNCLAIPLSHLPSRLPLLPLLKPTLSRSRPVPLRRPRYSPYGHEFLGYSSRVFMF